MHRFLDGDGAVLGDAAVIAGQQHRPLGERDEDGIVTLSFTGSSILPSPVSKRIASMSSCNCRRMAVCLSESKRATLKLVGSVTNSTLTFSSGGRIACGSGLHSVKSAGSKLSHTVGSV